MKINKDFGGWSINENCYNYLIGNFNQGSTMLELGSGYGTKKLSEYFNMYSIENFIEFCGLYDSHYIYAPIKLYDNEYTKPNLPEQKGWYDLQYFTDWKLPKNYDLILVDGPNGGMFGRGGFLKHLDLFKSDVPIIFDDINREPERLLMEEVAKVMNKKISIIDKATGIVT
mgnify:CR=1 FL=1